MRRIVTAGVVAGLVALLVAIGVWRRATLREYATWREYEDDLPYPEPRTWTAAADAKVSLR